MRQVAAGDGPAFTELFRRRHTVVFRFALHMTGSVSTAEDVVQDVFLIVMRDAVRYAAGRGAVVAWLCGIARNCVRQRMERDRRLAPLESWGGQEPASDKGGPMDALAGLLRTERIESLRRAVQSLPVPYREVLVLCDLQEMTYEDAAKALECPVGTVRSRLHRARGMLTAKLLAAEHSELASRSETPAENPVPAAGPSERDREAGPGRADAGGYCA